MGGGGLPTTGRRHDAAASSLVAVRPPGGRLAAAVEAAGDPVSGLVPAGFLPEQDSTDPWTQVIHMVIAARRIQGWLVYAQLTLLDRWAAAWRARPPVSNMIARESDRCESADPELTDRVKAEITRIERQLGGRFAPVWGGIRTAGADGDSLVGAELGLATGLSRTVSEQHVEAADALFTENRLPRLARLLQAGWVDWSKVQTFVHATTGLDLVVAHAVERMVLGDTPDEAVDVDVESWSTLRGRAWACR